MEYNQCNNSNNIKIKKVSIKFDKSNKILTKQKAFQSHAFLTEAEDYKEEKQVKNEIFKEIHPYFKFYMEEEEKLPDIPNKNKLSQPAISKLRPKTAISITNKSKQLFKNLVLLEKISFDLNLSQNLDKSVLLIKEDNKIEERILNDYNKENKSTKITKYTMKALNLVPDNVIPNSNIAMDKEKRVETNLINSKFLERLHISKNNSIHGGRQFSNVYKNTYYQTEVANKDSFPCNSINTIDKINKEGIYDLQLKKKIVEQDKKPKKKLITLYRNNVIDCDKDNHLIRMLKYKKQFQNQNKARKHLLLD